MNCDQYCHHWWGTWWPWAEANQGMLSVAAIALTATLALLEFRRANKAEALAKKIAEDAEAAEERRANEAIEREARQTREAEERRRHDEISRELLRISEYTTAARSMIRDAELALHNDRDRIRKIISETLVSQVLVNNYSSSRERAASEGLKAIAHAAPMDPQIILTSRKAALTLNGLADQRPLMASAGVDRWYQEALDSLVAIRQELTEHEIALANRIRFPPTPEVNPATWEQVQI